MKSGIRIVYASTIFFMVICASFVIAHLHRSEHFQGQSVAVDVRVAPIEIGGYTIKKDGNKINVIHSFHKHEIGSITSTNPTVPQVAELVTSLNAEFEKGFNLKKVSGNCF